MHSLQDEQKGDDQMLEALTTECDSMPKKRGMFEHWLACV